MIIALDIKNQGIDQAAFNIALPQNFVQGEEYNKKIFQIIDYNFSDKIFYLEIIIKIFSL